MRCLIAFTVTTNHQLIVDGCWMSWVVKTILWRWNIVPFHHGDNVLSAIWPPRSLGVIYHCIFLRVASIYLITRLRILYVATLFVTNSVRNGWEEDVLALLAHRYFRCQFCRKCVFSGLEANIGFILFYFYFYFSVFGTLFIWIIFSLYS